MKLQKYKLDKNNHYLNDITVNTKYNTHKIWRRSARDISVINTCTLQLDMLSRETYR